MVVGKSELLVILVTLAYVVFAYQLADLLRSGRYKQFLVRLLLSPVILLFDWPIRRRHWRDDGRR